ncbi:hypothetical protein VP1G_11500 [Cytospora mali]|uniref:Uncharacterized protein n=1 Tax=Cytospora mali TaxID=578113 RepID=A0A194VHC8_CYTMA|nr:hypothetical protein VP1G_11500 [Valsa mali var. pyri (nom. inval.)]
MPSQSLTLPSKTAALLTARLSPTSRIGYTKRTGVSSSDPHQRLLLHPYVATQLCRLSEGHKDQPQTFISTSEKPASSPEHGRVSLLDRMGANRTTKIVIVVFLCIYGTMETIFYVTAAYRHLSKRSH